MTWLWAFILLWPLRAFALISPLSDDCVQLFFALDYEDFDPKRCAHNAHEDLLRLAADPKFDIKKAKIVYLIGDVRLRSSRSTYAAEHGWQWHAFLVYDGRVLDKDYSAVPLQSVAATPSVREYALKNLGYGNPHETQLRGLRVRTIDGQYFKDYFEKPVIADGPIRRPQVIDSSYMMNNNLGSAAKDQTLEEFVESYAP